MRKYYDVDVNDVLPGRTISSIEGLDIYSNKIKFNFVDGSYLEMFYEECSPNVDCSVEDIAGDINILIGSPLLVAEESTQEVHGFDESNEAWTFYKFATAKGYVTIRWYGSDCSNFYGVKVQTDFYTDEDLKTL